MKLNRIFLYFVVCILFVKYISQSLFHNNNNDNQLNPPVCWRTQSIWSWSSSSNDLGVSSAPIRSPSKRKRRLDSVGNFRITWRTTGEWTCNGIWNRKSAKTKRSKENETKLGSLLVCLVLGFCLNENGFRNCFGRWRHGNHFVLRCPIGHVNRWLHVVGGDFRWGRLSTRRIHLFIFKMLDLFG